MPTVLTLLLCLLSLTAAAQQPGEPPRNVVKPRVLGLAANFVQVRHLGELDMDVESRGSVCCDFAGGRLRWQVDLPVASVTLIDGEKLTHYDAATGKTAVLEARKFPWLELLREALSDWLSGDRERLAGRFEVTPAGPGGLHLVPRDAALKKLFRGVDIAFAPDGGTVRRILITEDAGDTLEIRFSEVETDPKWSPLTWRMPER